MKINAQTPKIVLNKAFLKQRPLRSEIETFKANLKTLLSKVETKESEENKKNHVRDFLLDTYYKGRNEVNTKDRKDLVIHLGKTNESKVGVIIEAKTPESADMVRLNKLNAKAFHELVLYYFDERQTKDNSELKNLAITNTYEWFIFDTNVFDKQIYRNTQIKNLYKTYKNDKKDNPFFYEEFRKIIENLDEEIICTHFDLRNYKTFLDNEDLEDDKNLIELYKILSPFHLLKEPFAEDSNALNKPFYDELLHIIGLEEVKVKSKSIIRRKEEGNRDQGSLLENAMTMLKSKDSLRKVKGYDIAEARTTVRAQTEDTLTNVRVSASEDRYFNVALELCLIWINRILFLKLLESQLVSYHKGNREFRFLNIETINEFDELFTLFHQVLARKLEDRNEDIKEKYKRVPYLNSSLFEPSELEDQTITIESLKDSATLDFNKTTILKKYRAENKTFTTLEYLFKFLDAYDFASEGVEDVQEDNRSLINASVLGKVFEKINGYKDGSIFTPGFITMYMCRQAIRLAVIQKFKDKYGWNIEEFADIKNYLADRRSAKDILEFNELVNSLHLCDPAVGSGHFLVSSLNEIIAIKCELGILADEKGVRLSDYQITIENDKFIITDESGDIFEYQINENGKPTDKAQRLQKTLFHEKQTLIENCLFGVDINPNSVKICRLRLWIELLKNAYYKEEFRVTPSGVSASKDATLNFTELETLPNIDINIKEGNSLISRFSLDENLKEVLNAETRTLVSVPSDSETRPYSVRVSAKKSNIISDYRNAVAEYKRTRNRDEKRNLLEIIDTIKGDFKTEIYKNDPKMIELAKKERRLFEINSPSLFEKYSEGEREVLTANLEKQIAKTKQEIEDIKSNAIYKNAFEWRFEFPEVLDNEGNFLGFDIVIGNPPYIRQEELGTLKDYLKKDYEVFTGTADLLVYFYELGIKILTDNGKFSFITSNKFMRANYGKPLRNYLWKQNILDIVDFGELPVFDEASTFPVVVNLEKSENQKSVRFTQVKTLKFDSLKEVIKESSNLLGASAFEGESWTLTSSESIAIINKIKTKGIPLSEYVNAEIRRGILTGFNEAFVIDEVNKDELIRQDANSIEIIKPFIIGDDVRKYQIKDSKKKFLIFTRRGTNIEKYPAIKNYLENYKDRLKPGVKGGRKAGTYKWFEIQDSVAYYEDFENPKILYPEIAKESRFTLSDDAIYTNNKAFIIPKRDLFLLAFLNSKVAWFYLKNICSVLGDADKGGRLELRSIHVQTLPIPEITPEDQQQFIKLEQIRR